jgi:hypothetical protein
MSVRIEKLIQDIDQAYRGSPTPIPRVRALIHDFWFEESTGNGELYYNERRKRLAVRARKYTEELTK